MKSDTAVSLLSALAHPTRLAIFRLLVTRGEAGSPVGDILDALAVPPATLSFHLKELSHAGLLHARQESRFIFYSANYALMNELMGFLTENCCEGVSCELSAPTCCPSDVKV
ncbi:ArsR/SmtB family transcription factor [Permianibacter aggregans]|uniref:ArsR family transcriptional regulator n=1 Tax=Permianibacter aggregans TaxID=1510150 RepID=A0A4R6UE54_9GAMM|nr:metalloregulator ArsR/SmtB family transcription factor [Permianibacter aggregans]QGX38156.1 transcriptional regulator [Permianibacter aggregans]TDQ45001.1 ArsR family transcriptional regulator [Permianibacter aggregans]